MVPHRIPARLRVFALVDVAIEQTFAVLFIERRQQARRRPLGRLAGNRRDLVFAELVEKNTAHLGVIMLIAVQALEHSESGGGGGGALPADVSRGRPKRRTRGWRRKILLIDGGNRVCGFRAKFLGGPLAIESACRPPAESDGRRPPPRQYPSPLAWSWRRGECRWCSRESRTWRRP